MNESKSANICIFTESENLLTNDMNIINLIHNLTTCTSKMGCMEKQETENGNI